MLGALITASVCGYLTPSLLLYVCATMPAVHKLEVCLYRQSFRLCVFFFYIWIHVYVLSENEPWPQCVFALHSTLCDLCGSASKRLFSNLAQIQEAALLLIIKFWCSLINKAVNERTPPKKERSRVLSWPLSAQQMCNTMQMVEM